MKRASRKEQREVKRAIKAFQYRAKGAGEREKARRVSQMVIGELKPENGVIQQFETKALLPDGSVTEWDERLRCAGASMIDVPVEEGTEGQDRESYSDDQDRDSYTVEADDADQE